MFSLSNLYNRRLCKVRDRVLRIPINRQSKVVIFSDCHRGIGGWNDEFANNAAIYFAALRNYYKKGFTYIELGDGDELWEEKDYCKIINQYSHIFWLLSLFHQENRLYLIYGNHDIIKKNKKFVDKYLTHYYCDSKNANVPLLPQVEISEGLVLQDVEKDRDILLIHGHQGDVLNSKIWVLARFLVRFLWKPLEFTGMNNPTMPNMLNYKDSKRADVLKEWANRNQQYLIAGHTHRPEHPRNQGYYFNSGSCIHPRCITAIEIEHGIISLVKWSIEVDGNRKLSIEREVLEYETLESE